MFLLPRFIIRYGLTVFVLDGLESGTVVDRCALSHILEQTNELRTLSIRNTSEIEAESLSKMISMLGDLIKSVPPRLTDLDFSGIGGSAQDGDQLLKALYDSEMQIKKLDISGNPDWAQSESYFPMLCGVLSWQDNLESIDISQN